MKRSAVAIVEEFLQSDERAVRRNAVAALGVLGGEQALGLLGQLADRDRDAELRRDALRALLAHNPGNGLRRLLSLAATGSPEDRVWAQRELLGVGPDLVQGLADEIVGILQAAPKDADAYMLLGRLAAKRGLTAQPSPVGWRTRLRRADAMRSFDPDTGGRATGRVRPPGWLAVAGLRGGFVAAVVLLIVLALAEVGGPALSQAVGPLIAGVAVSPFLAMAVCRYAYPINLQADRPAAMTLEALNAARASLLPVPIAVVLPAVVVALALRGGFSLSALLEAVRTVVAGFLITIVTLPAIRAATLAAFGLAPSRLFGRVVQAGCGAVVGGTITSVGSAIALQLSGEPQPALEPLWLILCVAGAGVALAFATVDELALPLQAMSAPHQARLVLLLAPSVVLAFIVLTPPASPNPAPAMPRVEERSSVPQRIAFSVQQPVHAVVAASDHRTQPVVDLVVSLRRGEVTLSRVDDPPLIRQELERGEYEVLIERFGVGTSPPRRVTLAGVLARRLFQRPATAGDSTTPVPPYRVVITDEETVNHVDSLVRDGSRLVGRGRVTQGLARLRTADSLMPIGVVEPSTWLTACWEGTRDGLASRVLDACDRAVATESLDAGYREARAIARALAGNNRAGAVEDLRIAAEEEPDPTVAAVRSAWVRRLQAGASPRAIFPRSLLDTLRASREVYR